MAADNDSLKADLDRYFSALTDLQQFNGVLRVERSGKLILEEEYNITSPAPASLNVDLKHQFEIHSVSKLLARYLLVKMEVEDGFDPEQALKAFFPDFPGGEQISVAMLRDHRSGLPRELSEEQENLIGLSPQEILELIQQETLLFEPGTESQYSNLGYELLYQVISQHYEKPFASCVTDEIFIPLKMNRSGAHFHDSRQVEERFAVNHVREETNFQPIPGILDEEFSTARIFSTAEDLSKLLTHLRTSPLGAKMANEQGVISQSGGSDGVRAQALLSLEGDYQFVFLSNCEVMPFFKTIEDLQGMCAGKEVPVPKALNRKSIELARSVREKYVGRYQFADFGGLILEIKLGEKGLELWQEGELAGTLKPASETIFFDDPTAPESFRFVPNTDNTFDVWMGWKGVELPGKRISTE